MFSSSGVRTFVSAKGGGATQVCGEARVIRKFKGIGQTQNSTAKELRLTAFVAAIFFIYTTYYIFGPSAKEFMAALMVTPT